MLLTADWHLTDLPQDEYRWRIFDQVIMLAHERNDRELFMLGDLTDRKDKHSATLVNRLVSSFRLLCDHGITTTILMGNHDKPLNGVPFWQFLDSIETSASSKNAPRLRFITKPTPMGALLLLPYADNPAHEWRLFDLEAYQALFIHQTVTGVKADNGRILENNKMPILPRGVKVYSGDIHTPQVVGRVTYVGAPHPVKFGDTYPCRMLQLDENFRIVHIEELITMRKLMLDVEKAEDLERVVIGKNDQARVRVKLPIDRLDDWPAEQERIAEWARANGVVIASVEAQVEAPTRDAATQEDASVFGDDPVALLAEFAATEELTDSLLAYGSAMLRAELKG